MQKVEGPDKGDILVLSWGSTYGAAYTASENLRKKGYQVANTNLRHINPFPANLGDILKSYRHVLVPEMNLGQLQFLIQSRYLIKVNRLSKVQGRPFHVKEIEEGILDLLGGTSSD